MKYAEIRDALWDDSPLKLTEPQRRAYNVLHKLNEFGGFDHWWGNIDDDGQNEIFKALAKECK